MIHLEYPRQLFGAAEKPEQREKALQLPPWRLPLGEKGPREHRQPVNERCQLSVRKASQEATVLVTAAIVAVVMTPQNLDRRSA
jgi:hypothetical protein